MPPSEVTDGETFDVWVLDIVGYDARGGNAEVFATAEAAKASEPDIKWKPDEDGWSEDVGDSLSDMYVIYRRVVKGGSVVVDVVPSTTPSRFMTSIPGQSAGRATEHFSDRIGAELPLATLDRLRQMWRADARDEAQLVLREWRDQSRRR